MNVNIAYLVATGTCSCIYFHTMRHSNCHLNEHTTSHNSLLDPRSVPRPATSCRIPLFQSSPKPNDLRCECPISLSKCWASLCNRSIGRKIFVSTFTFVGLSNFVFDFFNALTLYRAYVLNEQYPVCLSISQTLFKKYFPSCAN